jgi:tetratricopeptide (TPR) repeat protein
MVTNVRSKLGFVCLTLALLCGLAGGQTYEINQKANTASSTRNAKGRAAATQDLGWGSNIEVARQARAAEDALRRGDYTAAMTYAERATKAAPQNTELWFLMGYAARLAGRYQVSIDAYQRGLQNQPNSVRGLSGLAQTYAKMGREEEARRLLLQVVQANPRDINSVQLAGELLLNSDPRRALELLRRADAAQPSPHTELLIARAYRQFNQPGQAQAYLNHARNRAPRDPEIMRAVASQYRDAGQYDRAVSALQNLRSKNPDVLAELAYTYELAGKRKQAADLYSELAESAKGNISLALSAAQALVNLGEPEAARGFLDKAAAVDPNHYRLHAIRGQLAESESRTPDAIHEYEASLKNLPRTPAEGTLYPIQLHLKLQDLYQQAGNQTEATAQLEAAKSAIQAAGADGTSRPEYLRLRAAIESLSGDLTGAGRDLKEALALAPGNINIMLNHANLLWKMGGKDAARDMFLNVLRLDPRNRPALSSLGFLARDMGEVKQAENYFMRAAKLNPNDFGPQVALGDLYSSQRDFDAAQRAYESAYRLMPRNALVVAGGAGAAIEARKLDLAKRWLDRSAGSMNQNAQVMRERERYLTLAGKYEESAELGEKVIELLPRDPQAPVYLAYDYYYLNRYDDAMQLIAKYDSILPQDKDLPLITGYIHVHDQRYQQAYEDFTRALERDPKMATGYANRGYVLNNLRRAAEAVKDFQSALRINPSYPEAHLGIAYAYLQLKKPRPALEHLDKVEKLSGPSHSWHLARGETFRQEQKWISAEQEYRAALAEVPGDFTTQVALGDVLFRGRKYHESIQALNDALRLSPNDPAVFAEIANAYAKLGDRLQTMRNVETAEQYSKGRPEIIMTTGEALFALGDRDAAMQRFSRALEAGDSQRVDIRLAIARIFVEEGSWDDAQRQIGLAFAEARVGDAPPVTADNLVEAANLLLAMHDFEPARLYFEKARLAGADQRVVGIGLANTYIAQGDTRRAESELALLGRSADMRNDYDYLVARANLSRQKQDSAGALAALAQAGTLAGGQEAEALQNAQLAVAGEEGRQITPNVSLLSTGSFAPVLEDINVYTLDAKISGGTNPGLLPPPRHSFQSLGAAHYRVHLSGLPALTGFVSESMTSGRFLFPSVNVIQDRHTYDTAFNGGIAPTLRLGSATFAFNTGLQFTVRRDTISGFAMNQNLFRQYVYLSTSPFFNWVSIKGSAVRESGPFTEQNLHSRDASASLELTVGRPWGRTAFITGYSVRDLLFRPAIREYYFTSTYAGIQRKIGKSFTLAILGEYLRSWRVEGTQFAIAQAMRPRARFEYRANSRWSVQGSFALSRGQGFHAYDNVESQFLVSYTRPVRRRFDDGTGDMPVDYPSRFSFGLQQQTFYNFGGQRRTVILPVVNLRLF